MVGLSTSSVRAAVGQYLKMRQKQLRWNSGHLKGKVSPNASPENVATLSAGPSPSALPLWQRLGPITKAAEAYGRAHKKRPYVVQFCSTIAIYLAADVSAQSMSGKEHDLLRTARSLTIGGAASVPNYIWFLWLANSFNSSSRLLSIGFKVIFNQVTFIPVFNMYFFSMQALLAGNNVQETMAHVKRTVPSSYINSWKVWPAVTAVNFAFIPLQYRSLFAGSIAVGWQTYLSFLNRHAELQKEAEEVGVISDNKMKI